MAAASIGAPERSRQAPPKILRRWRRRWRPAPGAGPQADSGPAGARQRATGQQRRRQTTSSLSAPRPAGSTRAGAAWSRSSPSAGRSAGVRRWRGGSEATSQHFRAAVQTGTGKQRRCCEKLRHATQGGAPPRARSGRRRSTWRRRARRSPSRRGRRAASGGPARVRRLCVPERREGGAGRRAAVSGRSGPGEGFERPGGRRPGPFDSAFREAHCRSIRSEAAMDRGEARCAPTSSRLDEAFLFSPAGDASGRFLRSKGERAAHVNAGTSAPVARGSHGKTGAACASRRSAVSPTCRPGIRRRVFDVSACLMAYVLLFVQSTASSSAPPLMTTPWATICSSIACATFRPITITGVILFAHDICEDCGGCRQWTRAKKRRAEGVKVPHRRARAAALSLK